MARKIIIIGGSAAGPKAAAKARRIDQQADITIIQKDPDLSMASCGYPYYVGGVFDNRNMLLSTAYGAVRDPLFFMREKNITARTNTEALSINRAARTVLCKNLETGATEELPYDRLILATGSAPVTPPVPGAGLEGITTLQCMRDADYLRRVRDEKKIGKAVVVGGGLIGIETCEALQLAGIETTVVEMQAQLLTFLDPELARLAENHMRAKGVNVITGNGIAEFLGSDGRLSGVKLANGTELPCELAVVAVGVRPNSALARAAGLEIGASGGISVNRYMQTSDENIFAAGDCVEIDQLITGTSIHAPYGDLANLEGRVAGENAAMGNSVCFTGTIQTGICKIFDFTAGTTGLNERAARAAGLDILTVINASPDKPAFMNGKLLVTKLVVEKGGRILGAQCVGPGDVSKQIAQWALAITGKLGVEDVVNADLPYAPPVSLAIDHFIATAHLMQNKMKGRLKGVSSAQVQEDIARGAQKPFLLDVREPAEFEAMRLGIGETLIPLGALRARLHELPEDKHAPVVTYCKISLRGYEAALILEANGWTNVRVMEGGIMVWPFAREK